MDHKQINDKKKNKRTRQKNERGDRKEESNDSPEIPDRKKTSDIPGLPSAWKVLRATHFPQGCQKRNNNNNSYITLYFVKIYELAALYIINIHMTIQKAQVP